jgi:hypothetical protein
LYGCETWSLTLQEEYGIRMSENRMLKKIFGLKREEMAGEDCIMKSFITCTLHQVLLG